MAPEQWTDVQLRKKLETMSEAHLIDLWVIKPLAACKVQINAHVIKASWQLVEELALLRNKRIRPPYKANCLSMAVLEGAYTHGRKSSWGMEPSSLVDQHRCKGQAVTIRHCHWCISDGQSYKGDSSGCWEKAYLIDERKQQTASSWQRSMGLHLVFPTLSDWKYGSRRTDCG